MKVVMQGITSVPKDGGVVENVLSGQRYERAPWPAIGALYVNGSGTAGSMKVELNVGGVSVSPPVAANIQNRAPVVPDDVLIDGWECLPNALIQLTVTNSAAAAQNVFWRVELQEVAVPGYNA